MLPLSFNQVKKALISGGAFFLLLAGTSCKKQEKSSAEWTSTPPPAESVDSASADESKSVNEVPASEDQVRFLAYNLKNYLTMRRGKEYTGKPEQEIEALVDLIVEQKPDMLGVCEIGTRQDLFDLQDRLKAKGLELTHFEHTGGADETRRLGFLSRFPITSANSQGGVNYELEGETRVISRGILDVTVDTGTRSLRFLGAHLKSKRPVDYADQELVRQNEAQLLRTHVDTILEENRDAPIIVYGDFNDTIMSKTLKILKGRRNSPIALADFYFTDSRGELWTHFWDYQDVYSRFDYILFSKAIKPMLVGKASHVVDTEGWDKASDHRALLLVLE